jgi:hypothetical protein
LERVMSGPQPTACMLERSSSARPRVFCRRPSRSRSASTRCRMSFEIWRTRSQPALTSIRDRDRRVEVGARDGAKRQDQRDEGGGRRDGVGQPRHRVVPDRPSASHVARSTTAASSSAVPTASAASRRRKSRVIGVPSASRSPIAGTPIGTPPTLERTRAPPHGRAARSRTSERTARQWWSEDRRS